MRREIWLRGVSFRDSPRLVSIITRVHLHRHPAVLCNPPNRPGFAVLYMFVSFLVVTGMPQRYEVQGPGKVGSASFMLEREGFAAQPYNATLNNDNRRSK